MLLHLLSKFIAYSSVYTDELHKMFLLNIFYVLLIALLPLKSEALECQRIFETCNKTENCCLGALCVNKLCSDGLTRSTQRGLEGPAFDYIEHELETQMNVDVSNHTNIKYLTPVSECGISAVPSSNETKTRRKRIVGGKAVSFGRYPWMVQLYLHNISFGTTSFHCGGTLISKRHILTAAHCLTRVGTALTLKAVVIGNHDRRAKQECDESNTTCQWSTHREIDDIVVHEHYSEGNLRNDIGIIRLNQDVEFTPLIRPICLPLNEKALEGWTDGKLNAVGWGTQNKYNDEGPRYISYKEQEVENTLVSRENCNRFFTRILGKLDRSQICAGGYPGKGDCQGDSGGPLLKKIPLPSSNKSDERYFQFGIVSTGAVIKCGYQGKPSVYSNVIYFMPWILDNIGPTDEKHKGAWIVSDNLNKYAGDTGTVEAKNESELIPAEELSSGTNVSVINHKNFGLLPKFPDCGAALTGEAPTPVRVKRIVGGRPTGIAVYPWMVQIYVRHSVTMDLHLRCSGVLISSKYVLTSAHCVTEITIPFTLDSVTIGGYNRMKEEECIGTECHISRTMFVEEVIIHEEYTKYAHDNDIALIQLPEEISFDRFIQPICLPTSEAILNKVVDKKFTTAGWGRVSSEAGTFSTSNLLNAVNVTLTYRGACNSVYSRQLGVLDRSKICCGGTAGKGECTGDGGGPLQKFINGTDDDSVKRYFQFGVISYSECGQQGMPTVYANVLYYMNWILNHMEA